MLKVKVFWDNGDVLVCPTLIVFKRTEKVMRQSVGARHARPLLKLNDSVLEVAFLIQLFVSFGGRVWAAHEPPLQT